MSATDSQTRPFPLPGSARAVLAVAAPGTGPQQWAGAPSAALDADGSIVLAYRVRAAGEDYNVIARSTDGERFTTIGTLTRDRLGAAMVERPALIRTEAGRWRMYVSCATPDSKHWWIGMLEAATAEGLLDAQPIRVFDGDAVTGVKDPVIRYADNRWHAWICCHHLEIPGDEDRMSTAYATSADGIDWQWHGTVLKGQSGSWDARGARLTSVLPDGRVSYDGRATAGENWFERTGLAAPAGESLRQLENSPIVDVRYLDVLPLPTGDYRIYYEARLPDESHELRTEFISQPPATVQTNPGYAGAGRAGGHVP